MAEGAPDTTQRRSTGEIPLSWAVPAEAVSDSGAGPVRSNALPVVIVFAIVVVVAVGLSMRLSSTSMAAASAARDVPTSPAPTAPAPMPALAVAAVEVADQPDAQPGHVDPSAAGATTPPTTTATLTPAIKPTSPEATERPITDDDRATAQTLISRARIAARDRLDDKALALAEQSVEADPACGACWKTLGFLRARAGDRAGARIARARADAMTHDEPLGP